MCTLNSVHMCFFSYYSNIHEQGKSNKEGTLLHITFTNVNPPGESLKQTFRLAISVIGFKYKKQDIFWWGLVPSLIVLKTAFGWTLLILYLSNQTTCTWEDKKQPFLQNIEIIFIFCVKYVEPLFDTISHNSVPLRQYILHRWNNFSWIYFILDHH